MEGYIHKYNTYEYSLPKYIISINRLFFYDVNGNRTELTRGNSWERRDNTLNLYTGSGIDSADDGNISGGVTLELECSKYAQTLANDQDYLEMPRHCEDPVVMYTCALIKIEDRASADEISYYMAPYNAITTEFKDQNVLDSGSISTMQYVGKDVSTGGGSYPW